MRLLALRIAAAIVIVVWYLSTVAAVPTPRDAYPADLKPAAAVAPIYLAMGDSLTAGLPYVAVDEVYAERIAAVKSWHLSLIAKSGKDVAWGRAHLDGYSERPSVVTVEFGTNDVVQRTPIADFVRDYADILAAFPDSRLICLGTWQASAAYDDAIRATCEDAGGRYVDLGSVFRANLRSPVDGFHPSADAQAVIARAVGAAFRRPRVTVS